MQHVEWLGVGHPRTGTGYTARLFQLWGLDVGHETFGKDGIVAWQFTHPRGPWTYMPEISQQIKQRPSWQHLVYPVRDPATSIASVFFTEQSTDRWRSERLGLLDVESLAERTVSSIVLHDRLVMRMQPNLHYRIEDEAEKLYNYVAEHRAVKWALPAGQVNTRRHKPIDEIMPLLEQIPDGLKAQLNSYAARWGYNTLF